MTYNYKNENYNGSIINNNTNSINNYQENIIFIILEVLMTFVVFILMFVFSNTTLFNVNTKK